MATEKIYSESEVAEIIRRAGEIQEEKSEHGYVPGVNTNELAQIAQEVGIQHEFLEVALREHSSESMGVSRKKSTRTESIERVVPVEISPEDFDVITEDLKVIPAMSLSGSKSSGLSQFGRTVTGQVHEAWDNPHFKLNSRVDEQKLRFGRTNRPPLLFPFFGCFLSFSPPVRSSLADRSRESPPCSSLLLALLRPTGWSWRSPLLPSRESPTSSMPQCSGTESLLSRRPKPILPCILRSQRIRTC